MFFHLAPTEHAQGDENLPEAEVRNIGLEPHGRIELGGRDPAGSHQHVPQPVPPVDNRGMDDEPIFEEDRSVTLSVRQGEAPRPAPQKEELHDVGEARFPQAALDRHQRNSSSS